MQLTNDSIRSGFWGFANNPIVLQLEKVAGDYPSDGMFPQVVVKVIINYGSTEAVVYELSTLATDVVTIDVSSAFQAYLSRLSQEVNLTYLYELLASGGNADLDEPVKGRLQVWKRYFVDGEETEYQVSNIVIDLNVLRGGVSEAKRWAWGQLHANNVLAQYSQNGGGRLVLSNKPMEAEVRGVGDRLAVAEFTTKDGTTGIFTLMYPVAAAGWAGSAIEEAYGRSVYVEEDEDRREFVFENSYGVMETCSAKFLEAENHTVESSAMVYKGEPSFLPQNKYYSKNSIGAAEWSMSSGYVSLEQAKWWLGEFCGAKHVYMRLSGGKLLPVMISLKKATLYDRSAGADLPHVDFVVSSGYKGDIEL